MFSARFLSTLAIGLLVSGTCLYAQKQTAHNNHSESQDSLRNTVIATRQANRVQAGKIHYRYFITNAAGGTYGYSIYANGELFISQQTIPAIPGNLGFSTANNAKRAAQLIIQKIKMGEMPPTLTVEEMRRIKIIP